AVAIVIPERAAGAEPTHPDAGLAGHVRKRVAAVVVVEDAATEPGNQQVEEAVVIVIAGAAANSVVAGSDARLPGHVREGAVPVVVIEPVAGGCPLGGSGFVPVGGRQRPAIDQEDVGMAVVVVV